MTHNAWTSPPRVFGGRCQGKGSASRARGPSSREQRRGSALRVTRQSPSRPPPLQAAPSPLNTCALAAAPGRPRGPGVGTSGLTARRDPSARDIPDRRSMHDASPHRTFRAAAWGGGGVVVSLGHRPRRRAGRGAGRGGLPPSEERPPHRSRQSGHRRRSVLWDELGLIALLLFSAGSRTAFTQTEKNNNNESRVGGQFLCLLFG